MNPLDIYELEAVLAAVTTRVIDLRDPEDFAREHIPWARSVPHGCRDPFARAAAQIRGAERVIVYCDDENCGHAEYLAARLTEAGRPAWPLAGGFHAWIGQRRPTASLLLTSVA